MQIRTEVIGLANFLFRARVSGIVSSVCGCDYHRQTARHIIMDCPLYNKERLRASIGKLSFRTLAETAKRLKKVTKWLMSKRLLEQFGWATDFLYEKNK